MENNIFKCFLESLELSHLTKAQCLESEGEFLRSRRGLIVGLPRDISRSALGGGREGLWSSAE